MRMARKCHESIVRIIVLGMMFSIGTASLAESDRMKDTVYPVKKLKPRDTQSKLKVGDVAPDFTLTAIDGEKISLSQYRGKKNVVLSFVPAAWTPVCTNQWMEYNSSKDTFDQFNSIVLGITVDNNPTLFAWTKMMCERGDKVWFPVLSDFWPRGGMAQLYGVLRSEGVTERALFVVDKKGIIRYMDVHDINEKPNLEELVKALSSLP